MEGRGTPGVRSRWRERAKKDASSHQRPPIRVLPAPPMPGGQHRAHRPRTWWALVCAVLGLHSPTCEARRPVAAPSSPNCTTNSCERFSFCLILQGHHPVELVVWQIARGWHPHPVCHPLSHLEGLSYELSAMWFRSQDPIGEGHVETRDRRAPAPDAVSVHRLQRKLKEAARKVLHLGLEKEQLLEMGNRLRAERGRPPGESGSGE